MTYEELAVMQASRAKTFSAAQTDAMAAYCQAEHDLKELQADNAKLRKERDFYFQQVTDNGERAHGAIDALNAENAKLRELVRDVWVAFYAATPSEFAEVKNRVRELGIEVDV